MKQTGGSSKNLRRSSITMKTLFLILIGFSDWCSVTAGSKLYKPHLSGPSAALIDSVETFFCKMPQNSPNTSVTLKLYNERNLKKVFGEHTANFGEEAIFPLLVSEAHDGRLICEASGNNNTDIESAFSDSLEFKVISPVEGARIVSDPSSQDLWEGQALTLQCKITKGTHVSYDWLKNGEPIHTGHNTSILILRALSVRHTGDYRCVASNRLNDTMLFNSSSQFISVRVKEFISKPEMSLEVMKTDAGDFKVIVRCQSEKGTPLNTFSLLNATDIISTETTDRLQALFNVSIQLNRDMGWVRCNASNHGNGKLSDPKNLTVESVGGDVTVTFFKHVSRDFQVIGVVLRCKVERGTFPKYQWFLNNSRLEGRARFYAVGWTDDSILSLSVSQHSSGYYHCEASNTFDNNTRVRSQKILIDGDELNRVSTSALVVVFTCFLLLMVAVTSCCIYGAVLRRRYSRKHRWNERPEEAKVPSRQDDEEENEDEDCLMLLSYKEDVIHADRMSELPSEEDEASVDESVLYEGALSE